MIKKVELDGLAIKILQLLLSLKILSDANTAVIHKIQKVNIKKDVVEIKYKGHNTWSRTTLRLWPYWSQGPTTGSGSQKFSLCMAKETGVIHISQGNRFTMWT